ncbi:hypothetical protein [Neobacillus dielmonensis]|uniref:hypothetical protein n=1 Tax=Neobacillus dielmonensis TaxID=1347369 RepID=UPI0005AAB34A|nr:hypothetical protein [Neobacillus dielmonensis]
MEFIRKLLESLHLGNRYNKILIAEQIERDFNTSYPVYVDYFLSYEIGSINLPSSIIEEMRNDFEFNVWFLNHYIIVMFSYGWIIGFLSKYNTKYDQLNKVIYEFNEEAKEHLLSSANNILNYFGHQEIANIYTTCGSNMFHEGKDAGKAYNGSVEINKL